MRKSAHFIEYFIFGVFCSILAILWRKNRFLLLIPLLLGVLTALKDEMIIQRFLVTGRTSTMKDVLLDSIGFYLAAIMVFAVFLLWSLIKYAIKRSHHKKTFKI